MKCRKTPLDEIREDIAEIDCSRHANLQTARVLTKIVKYLEEGIGNLACPKCGHAECWRAMLTDEQANHDSSDTHSWYRDSRGGWRCETCAATVPGGGLEPCA